MCLGSGKAKGVLGDSLSSCGSGFAHRRWARMRNQNGKSLQKSAYAIRLYLCPLGEERRATSHCFSAAKLEMRNVAQLPVSRGGFPGCESQPQEEMNSSCKEEPVSRRGLNCNHPSLPGVPRVLSSASLQSVCWFHVPFRYS